MPLPALNIPTRTQGGGDPPADVAALAAKLREIALAVGATPISIPQRAAGAGTRDLFRQDMNLLLGTADALASSLSVGLTGLSAWAPGYSLAEEHVRINAIVTKVNQVAAVVPVPPVSTAPKRMIHMGGSWDDDITTANKAAFESKISAIVGFRGSPAWDTFKTWNLQAFAYQNVFSDTGNPWVASNYQLDSDGAPLWLPFNDGGVYYRRSVDLRATGYRTGIVNSMKAHLADGAEGVFFDDVNLNAGAMFGRGTPSSPAAPLTDFMAAGYYPNGVAGTGWPALLADFLHDVIAQVRVTYPAAKFILNTQPWWLEPARWTDPRAIRMVDAGDWICIEHGFSDLGLQDAPGTDTGTNYPVRSLAKYVDMIHSRGKAFMQYASSQPSNAGQNVALANRYEMAWHLAKRDPSKPDMIGIWVEGAAGINGYDPVFDTDLGARTSYTDPSTAGSTITAGFTGGSVKITPPVSNTPKTAAHSTIVVG